MHTTWRGTREDGATLVCLEALVLGLAAAGKAEAIATSEGLDQLRIARRGR